VVAVLAFANKLTIAQGPDPETDPRFEKLAKEFYPKAESRKGRWSRSTRFLGCRSYSARYPGRFLGQRFPGINTSYWQATTRSEINDPHIDRISGESSGPSNVILTEAPLVCTPPAHGTLPDCAG